MSEANNACRVSVLYTTHRPETVDALYKEMSRHEAVFLEEPSFSDFPDMLEGRIPIEDYLMSRDDEYPEFALRSCRMFQTLHRRGTSLFQVEPFIEELLISKTRWKPAGLQTHSASKTAAGYTR